MPPAGSYAYGDPLPEGEDPDAEDDGADYATSGSRSWGAIDESAGGASTTQHSENHSYLSAFGWTATGSKSISGDSLSSRSESGGSSSESKSRTTTGHSFSSGDYTSSHTHVATSDADGSSSFWRTNDSKSGHARGQTLAADGTWSAVDGSSFAESSGQGGWNAESSVTESESAESRSESWWNADPDADDGSVHRNRSYTFDSSSRSRTDGRTSEGGFSSGSRTDSTTAAGVTSSAGTKFLTEFSSFDADFVSTEKSKSVRERNEEFFSSRSESNASGYGIGFGDGGSQKSQFWGSRSNGSGYGGDWVLLSGADKSSDSSWGFGESSGSSESSQTDDRDLPDGEAGGRDTFTGGGTTDVEWNFDSSSKQTSAWDPAAQSWGLVSGERSASSDQTETSKDRADGTFRSRIGGPLPGMTAEVSGVYESRSNSARSKWDATDSEVRDGEWVQTFGYRYEDGSGSGHTHRTASGDGEYQSAYLAQGGAEVSATLSGFQDKQDTSFNGHELKQWDDGDEEWTLSGEATATASATVSYGFQGSGSFSNENPSPASGVPDYHWMDRDALAEGEVKITGSYTQDRTENGEYRSSLSHTKGWSRAAGESKIFTDSKTYDDSTTASRLHSEAGSYLREGGHTETAASGGEGEQRTWTVKTTSDYSTTWIKDYESERSGTVSTTSWNAPWGGGTEVLDHTDGVKETGAIGVWWYHDSTMDHKEELSGEGSGTETYIEYEYRDELWDSEDRHEPAATVEHASGGPTTQQSGEYTLDRSSQSKFTMPDGYVYDTGLLRADTEEGDYDVLSSGGGYYEGAYFLRLDRDPEAPARNGRTPGASRTPPAPPSVYNGFLDQDAIDAVYTSGFNRYIGEFVRDKVGDERLAVATDNELLGGTIVFSAGVVLAARSGLAPVLGGWGLMSMLSGGAAAFGTASIGYSGSLYILGADNGTDVALDLASVGIGKLLRVAVGGFRMSLLGADAGINGYQGWQSGQLAKEAWENENYYAFAGHGLSAVLGLGGSFFRSVEFAGEVPDFARRHPRTNPLNYGPALPSDATPGMFRFGAYRGPRESGSRQQLLNFPPHLPPYQGGKVSGIFRGGNRDIALTSGYDGPTLFLPRKGNPGMNNNIKSHVEAHAVALMKIHGIRSASLYINKIPCPGSRGCHAQLETMLPTGYVLEVFGPNGFHHVYTGN